MESFDEDRSYNDTEACDDTCTDLVNPETVL
jgi:hypothetical protein